MDKESIQVINCNKKELGKNWLIAFDPKNTKFLESAEYSGDLNGPKQFTRQMVQQGTQMCTEI